MKDKEREAWFRNYYYCRDDDTQWDDEWDCMCNDRCPTCNKEIEPYHSEDLTNT